MRGPAEWGRGKAQLHPVLSLLAMHGKAFSTQQLPESPHRWVSSGSGGRAENVPTLKALASTHDRWEICRNVKWRDTDSCGPKRGRNRMGRPWAIRRPRLHLAFMEKSWKDAGSGATWPEVWWWKGWAGVVRIQGVQGSPSIWREDGLYIPLLPSRTPRPQGFPDWLLR